MQALAIANNDIVYLFWTIDKKIPNCLGFTIRRLQPGKPPATLAAFVGFEKGVVETDPKRRNTDFMPIQSFQWKDVFVPEDTEVEYEIAAVTGTPGKKLTEIPGQSVRTNKTAAADQLGAIRVVFNRGIISTQATARKLKNITGPNGKPVSLTAHVKDLKSPIRKALAGEAPDALTTLLRRARAEGGKCFCALYELSDPQLIQELIDTKGSVEIILSNTGADDATNKKSRAAIHKALGNAAVHDRMLGGAGFFIGHNKFTVYVDEAGNPAAVLTGSTNWTPTGLCAQTNNAILIESPELAQHYLDYWNMLLVDKAQQDAPLRTFDATATTPVDLPKGEGTIQVWFSPNTPQKRKPAKAATPPDLTEVFDLISNAQHGVLFLLFNSGSPSIASHLRTVTEQRKAAGEDLYVRGAISDENQANEFRTRVYNDSMLKAPNVLITGIAGVNDAFAIWEKEIAKLGHAVIHDKIVVIDPFSADPTVITGSHNLGFKASYSNDENMTIIRGNRALAQSYAAHVLDVVNHFNFRRRLNELAAEGKLDQAFSDLDESDKWQDKYFKGNFLANRDRFFFANPALTAATAKKTAAKKSPAKKTTVKKAAAGGA